MKLGNLARGESDGVLKELRPVCQEGGAGYDAVFFFSSSRRHPRSLCDWSSDVCSSDLRDPRPGLPGGDGLRAVTVVGADAADAEVDAKTLFLEGHIGIADTVRTAATAA